MARNGSVYVVKPVTHAFFFRVEIGEVEFVWGDLDGYILDNFQTVPLKSDAFHRIVCDKTHALYTELVEYLCAYSIIALVSLMSQMDVCLDCVKSLFLEFVCAYLVHEPYATSLLVEIEYDSAVLFLHHLHGAVQLLAAVAAARTEYIAGGA